MTQAEIQTLINVLKNETVEGANTKVRVANILENILNSSGRPKLIVVDEPLDLDTTVESGNYVFRNDADPQLSLADITFNGKSLLDLNEGDESDVTSVLISVDNNVFKDLSETYIINVVNQTIYFIDSQRQFKRTFLRYDEIETGTIGVIENGIGDFQAIVPYGTTYLEKVIINDSLLIEYGDILLAINNEDYLPGGLLFQNFNGVGTRLQISEIQATIQVGNVNITLADDLIKMAGLQEYIDNADAVSNGLPSNSFYKTSDGTLKITI